MAVLRNRGNYREQFSFWPVKHPIAKHQLGLEHIDGGTDSWMRHEEPAHGWHDSWVVRVVGRATPAGLLFADELDVCLGTLTPVVIGHGCPSLSKHEACRTLPSVGASNSSETDFHSYFVAIARARSVIRRTFRMIDEQAKRFGLEALEHQTLIQVYGVGDDAVQVRDLAERLDISQPHASRLVSMLEERGLVTRGGSPDDQRATIVRATEAGVELLRQIDAKVRFEVAHYERQLQDTDRFNALSIFAFYVGLNISPEALAGKLGSP